MSFEVKEKKYGNMVEFQVRPLKFKIGVDYVDVVVGRGKNKRLALRNAIENINETVEYLEKIQHDIRMKFLSTMLDKTDHGA